MNNPDKLNQLKQAVGLLEGIDIEALQRALSMIGEPVEESGVNEMSRAPGSKVKIVVLQRGWVVVGEYSCNVTTAMLTRAAVIRVWGTTKGLGELALNGPTPATKLDPCGVARFELLTAILTLDVMDDALWFKKLS